MKILEIAEVLYENGNVRYLYSRYLSDDLSHWVRHGLFRAYYENGNLASEGEYYNGYEEGEWKDFHTNGVLAARGTYTRGIQNSDWSYWDINGKLEQ